MSTQRFIVSFACCLAFFVACSDNSPTDNVLGEAVPINWVGSETVYSDIEGKKAYSMIFFYTDWCGYCKRMDDITFADPTVSNIINDSFNAVRINAELDTLVVHFDSTVTCEQMADIYGIGGYPTTCFFDSTGNFLGKILGYSNPTDFTYGLGIVLSGDYK